MKEVRVAMMGFGGIAQSHRYGYERLKAEGYPVRLVAVCDVRPEVFLENGEKKACLAGINTYTAADDMLAAEEFDMADICLPSYLHKEYAVKMMKAGKHVLSEKPMALSSADAAEMTAVSHEMGVRLMIGQCLRFDPVYLYLKGLIDSGEYGKLRTLVMERLSGRPGGGYQNWYAQTEKSGGALFDLHIHDVDMIRFLLGEPTAVSALALDEITRWQYMDSRFYYPETVVSAVGSFDETGGFPFHMDYRATFDSATVQYYNYQLTVYPKGGKPFQPELPNKERMTEEIRHLTSLILDPEKENEANPPESALQTIVTLEKLRDSADQGGLPVSIA